MPDIQPKDEPKVERKDLPKLAQIAVREMNKNFERSLDEILTAAGESLGLDPKEGWQFDQQSMQFVKQEQPK